MKNSPFELGVCVAGELDHPGLVMQLYEVHQILHLLEAGNPHGKGMRREKGRVDSERFFPCPRW
jgi:hypothetical protein